MQNEANWGRRVFCKANPVRQRRSQATGLTSACSGRCDGMRDLQRRSAMMRQLSKRSQCRPDSQDQKRPWSSTPDVYVRVKRLAKRTQGEGGAWRKTKPPSDCHAGQREASGYGAGNGYESDKEPRSFATAQDDPARRLFSSFILHPSAFILCSRPSPLPSPGVPGEGDCAPEDVQNEAKLPLPLLCVSASLR
jgi:hypothetical protein